MIKLLELLNEDETIECEKCGWRWKLSQGGEDPYLCHKCDFDNVNHFYRRLLNYFYCSLYSKLALAN